MEVKCWKPPQKNLAVEHRPKNNKSLIFLSREKKLNRLHRKHGTFCWHVHRGGFSDSLVLDYIRAPSVSGRRADDTWTPCERATLLYVTAEWSLDNKRPAVWPWLWSTSGEVMKAWRDSAGFLISASGVEAMKAAESSLWSSRGASGSHTKRRDDLSCTATCFLWFYSKIIGWHLHWFTVIYCSYLTVL